MKAAHFLSVAALAGAALLAPQAASAQQSIDSLGLTITTTPAVVSDYLFRGISQTRGGPALQATIDVEHASGVYIGGFISNVAWPTVTPQVDIRQEVDFNAGYRFSVGDVKLDLGVTYFGYPGYTKPRDSYDWAWWEFNLRAAYELDPLKFVGQVSYSPNFNYESGQAWYVEAGFDAKLAYDITASVRVGYQWIQRNVPDASSPVNRGYWGAPDYGVASISFSREITAGLIGSIGLTTTTLRENGSATKAADCFGGTDREGLGICGTRFVVGVSRPF